MSLRPDDARARRPPGADRLARVLRAGLRFTERARATGVPNNDEGASPIFRSLPSELWNVIMEQLAIADGACTSVPELCGILKVLLKRLSPGEYFLGVCDSPQFWKAACEHRGWTFDSADYAPPIKEGDNQELARWREQYLLFCSVSGGLANKLHLALYYKLINETYGSFHNLYEETYGERFSDVWHVSERLKEEFPAYHEFESAEKKANDEYTWDAMEEIIELYDKKEPDNRENYAYQPSSPTSPPHESDDDDHTDDVQLPAGYTDEANATFGSIVNTVGEYANKTIDVTINSGWTEVGLAFDPSVRHIRYLVSMIRNVAMVGAKHAVHMYENRPERPDPLNPLDVHAWKAHSDRYKQVVAEFRKIAMETPAALHSVGTTLDATRWSEYNVNERTRLLGLTFDGNVVVDEKIANFTLWNVIDVERWRDEAAAAAAPAPTEGAY